MSRITVNVPEEIADGFKALASLKGITVSEYCARLMTEAVKANQNAVNDYRALQEKYK